MAEVPIQLSDRLVADRLATWARAWGRPVVIDTHPRTGAIADGAMSAASIVAVPVLIGSREFEALGGRLRTAQARLG